MGPYIKQLPIPHSILLIILGYCLSQASTLLAHLDTGIRWHHIQPIVFYILLPVIIYRSAVLLDMRIVRDNLLPLFLLVLPLMLLSTLWVAGVLYFGINHPAFFSIIIALLTGALLSAIDPDVIIPILERYHVPEKIINLLQTEGLLSDVGAIFLFSFILFFIQEDMSNMGLWPTMSIFTYRLIGAVLLGVLLIIILRILMQLKRFLPDRLLPPSQSTSFIADLSLAYGSFALSEILQLSGVITLLTVSFYIAYQYQHQYQTPLNFNKFSTRYAWVSKALIYFLSGVTINLIWFVDQWLAVLIAISAVLSARFLIIFVFLSAICRFFSAKINLLHQSILYLGSTRGTVTMALALSLPVTMNAWYTVQAIAYGVVLFTLFTYPIGAAILGRQYKPSD